VNFSLDVNCQFEVKVDMLLEGEQPPLNLYTFEIFDQDGSVIPGSILTGDHIGQTLNYSIGNMCDLNTCGGNIYVNDYYPPVLYCDRDTISCLDSITPDSIGFPLDTALIDTMYYVGNNKYILENWDACSDASLVYADQLFTYDCDSAFQELIVRTWIAEDAFGNSTSCNDSIFVERVLIDDLFLPPSYNNIDSAALECEGSWIALDNGNPSPETTGYPITGGCGDISYQYVDTRFESCGNSFDVFRDWTIMDWCSQELVHWGQIIKIMDNNPPQMTCPEDTVFIGADYYNCYSESHQLQIPDVYDNCGTYTLEIKVYEFGDINQAVEISEFNGNYFVAQLPLGAHEVVIEATDECGNSSTCSYTIVARDDVMPNAICDEHTQVSLGSNGVARLYATSLDDGSFDNCEIVSYEVVKMTDECGFGHDVDFTPYVDFCCEEVGDTVLVSMRVTDSSGNSNECMVEVLVEDKYFPGIICPPDITISCDFYYNPNDLGAYFGNVVTSEEERQDIVINDYFNNGVVGQDGLAYDNCNVRVDTTVEFDLNQCNVGVIYRTFTAVDDQGLKKPCLQRIFIEDPDPFDESDIVWPSDVEMNGCLAFNADTSVTGQPIVDDDACSLVAVSFEDQLFTIVDDACEKLVRKWTVIDWCQFDHNTLEGQWTYSQVIKLYNEEAPEFTSDCNDREVCVYGNCEGLVELQASAQDDCTPEEQLNWIWRLDRDNDGDFDDFGQGSYFARILDQGTHSIQWTVEDKCGNESFCSYEFTVTDCKRPTPYCISSLTTVVMNTNGMVTVVPENYDIGSYDNCTKSEDLLLSWSPDVNDTEYTITCDSMGGYPQKTFYLDLWVTDEAGNQEYCSIWLEVQDNFNVCDDPDLNGLVMAGNVSLAGSSIGIGETRMKLNCSQTEYSSTAYTDEDGSFSFDDLPNGYDYEIKAVNNENSCNEGVSTLDLVFIQRHLLGLELLDSPYKMLAADANNSSSISAADILEIRKVILGVQSDFNKSECWKYITKEHEFDNQYKPWDAPSSYQYSSMDESELGNNFYAVKTGDVNISYSPLTGNEEVDSRSTVALYIDNNKEQQEAGLIPVYTDGLDNVVGMQFTLETSEDLKINGIEAGQLNIGTANYALHNQNKDLTLSWNLGANFDVNTEEPLFYLRVEGKNHNLTAGDVILSSKITDAVVYSESGNNSLTIDIRSGLEEGKNALFQNKPNPFSDESIIAFEIIQAQDVQLDIFDTNGKVVFSHRDFHEKGVQELKVSSSLILKRGIYYYTMRTEDFVATKKMIYLK